MFLLHLLVLTLIASERSARLFRVEAPSLFRRNVLCYTWYILWLAFGMLSPAFSRNREQWRCKGSSTDVEAPVLQQLPLRLFGRLVYGRSSEQLMLKNVLQFSSVSAAPGLIKG